MEINSFKSKHMFTFNREVNVYVVNIGSQKNNKINLHSRIKTNGCPARQECCHCWSWIDWNRFDAWPETCSQSLFFGRTRRLAKMHPWCGHIKSVLWFFLDQNIHYSVFVLFLIIKWHIWAIIQYVGPICAGYVVFLLQVFCPLISNQ